MAFSVHSNFFEYFEQPVQFGVDLKALHQAQIALQAELHPDRFVTGSAQEKRVSVQKASMVNEAYQTLKEPVKRAHYLLELAGIEKNDNQTTSDASFLMEQISFREEMGECRTNTTPLDCIDHLTAKLKQRAKDFSQEFEHEYDRKEFETAQESARKMMFVKKILDQLNDLQAEIEDEMM